MLFGDFGRGRGVGRGFINMLSIFGYYEHIDADI